MSPKMWEYVIRKCPALKANCCNHVYTFFIKKMFQTYKNSAYDEFTGSECVTKDTHKKFIEIHIAKKYFSEIKTDHHEISGLQKWNWDENSQNWEKPRKWQILLSVSKKLTNHFWHVTKWNEVREQITNIVSLKLSGHKLQNAVFPCNELNDQFKNLICSWLKKQTHTHTHTCVCVH